MATDTLTPGDGRGLGRYVLRRVGWGLVTLLAVQLLLVLLLAVTPGDAIERAALASEEGMADACIEAAATRGPWPALLRLGFDPGATSLVSCRPVLVVLGERIGVTLGLMIAGLLLGNAVGVACGARQGTRPGDGTDRALQAGWSVLLATPTLVLAVGAELLAVLLGLPVGGMGSARTVGSWWIDRLRHLVLPTLVLALRLAAGTATVTRGSILTAADGPLGRHLLARGLPEDVVRRRIVAQAAVPVAVVVVGSLPRLVAGSVLVETVFAWPGMGQLLAHAALAQDLPVLLAAVSVVAVCVVGASIFADLVTAALDPRVRLR